jgi:hypothetical protein
MLLDGRTDVLSWSIVSTVTHVGANLVNDYLCLRAFIELDPTTNFLDSQHRLESIVK